MANKLKAPASAEDPVLSVKVRTIDLSGKGFYGKYREVITFKQAFMDPMEARVQDVDAGFEFLVNHIEEPSDRADKVELLEKLDAEQFVDLFEMIAGQNSVPPVKGGRSENSSE